LAPLFQRLGVRCLFGHWSPNGPVYLFRGFLHRLEFWSEGRLCPFLAIDLLTADDGVVRAFREDTMLNRQFILQRETKVVCVCVCFWRQHFAIIIPFLLNFFPLPISLIVLVSTAVYQCFFLKEICLYVCLSLSLLLPFSFLLPELILLLYRNSVKMFCDTTTVEVDCIQVCPIFLSKIYFLPLNILNLNERWRGCWTR
jgi:hypothetical protein